MKTKLPNSIITENLIIHHASIRDCDILKKICDSWNEQKVVEGHVTNDNYFFECMNNGDLPPGGIKENYSLMLIKLRANSVIVGYFDLYHGYPVFDTLWISIFVVDKNYRNRGIGKEAIGAIFKYAIDCGWSKIGIGVYLKNWSALRFWISLGFDKILSIYGDKEYSVDTFSLIGLQKLLAE